MNFRLILGLLAIASVLGCTSPASTPKVAKNTVATQLNPIMAEAGLGADQRPVVRMAISHIKGRRLAEAGNVLDQALTAFRDKMRDPNAIYVSVATRDELEAYKKEIKASSNIVWMDASFGEALHLKAFIESASKRFEAALRFLDEEIKYAPTAAAPHVERGYILNQQNKSKAALEAYTLALDRSRKYASSAGTEAAALRGIGVTLIDLHDLDGAEQYLQESLKIEPGNQVAVHELAYIRQLRAVRSTR
jgi:tetratricopeptide (TPR) repeat protein